MKALLGAIAASCLVAVAILLLSFTTYFDGLNHTAYDFTLRLAGPVPIKSPVLIAAIDEESLHRLGRWPWSRDKIAKLIDTIETGNPRAIAVDVLLDDKGKLEEDYALATAIANAHAVVLGAHLEEKDGVERWNQPDALFLKMGVRLGHVHTDPDFDGINRRILSVKATADGAPMPAFAVQTLHAAELPFKADFERKVGTAEVYQSKPINIRFVGDNGSFRQIPAWQLLDGTADARQFKDQVALIGFTAEGVGDQWFTPFAQSGRKMSGVEIHANAIDTLYSGRAITEASVPLLLLGLILYTVLLWWLDRKYEGWRFYLLSLLTGPGVLILSWMLMKYTYFWLPFPPFWAALVVAVPGLEVTKLIRVNWDLDRKIERLSTGWLAALNWYEPEWPESKAAVQRRSYLLARRQRNARWKLHAIDFFNEELMEFLSFNNAILASIDDVIIVCDRDGRVVYQNPSAKRLTGYRENPGQAPEYLASVLDGRKIELEPGILHFVPAQDGKTLYNVTVTPISTAGVVFSLHDATAQHELNQAKSEMVSLVSHELRTPLTSIRGYSEMLLKYNLVQDKGKEFLGTIIDESNRLNQLIQSFLDIAYIESGRQKITMSDFEVGPVLKDLATVVGPVAAGKDIAVVTPELNGLRVRADRLLLYQALTNLVTNAIKYSPAGTTVRIGVSNGSGAVRFQVADQGFGIPADEASKVFEKFYRRGNKETREQSGFGLGLAFVKEVALRHGGDVIVESEVGKGSVFTLSIPI
ncbi:MAG TPA: CHASE2 domain-containing protein [Terriglobia bacterium]|nr:CHASE2 domain-containing protein [Terriglobia bacterium]